MFRGLRAAGRGLRLVFLDGPRWLLRHPGLRAFFDSPVGVFLWRFAVLPLPPVLFIRANAPMAVLLAPVVLSKSAPVPTAVFSFALLRSSAPAPTAVL